MKPDLVLLKQLLSLPTAPFHEREIIHFIRDFCRRFRLRRRQDRYGNLKVTYKNGARSPVALTAHMDHPGFEVLRGGTKPVVRLLGGVPDRFFKKAKVVFWNGEHLIRGRVAKIHNAKKRQYRVATAAPVGKGVFGYFDLPGCVLKNGLIYTKAADNLMSVVCLLNLLKILARKKPKAHVVCLFTRAEEVGFVGASGAVKTGFLSKKMPVVVMESSSAKAGRVDIGAGPVLRVGDRFSTFSPDIDVWLRTVAEGLQKRDRKFRYQRALLPGGRCEASFYVSKGYAVGGMAFPLGNYHNAGGKNYAAEYISLRDYERMLAWLLALATSAPPARRIKSVNKGVETIFARYSGRLLKKIAE